MDHLEGLNPAQLEAVQIVDGPLLIVAGPGSGKTRVIIHRIAHLIEAARVAPWNILAVTFTNKAAREMRERLTALLGPGAGQVAMGTFHAQCARMLRRDGAAGGIDPRFAIYDDGDQQGLVRRILKDLQIDEQRFTPRAFLSAISAAKSELITASAYRALAHGFWQQRVAEVYEPYQAALRTNRALDFDDLIGETVRLLTEVPEVLENYRRRFRYILVDEFQDTNVAQYRLVKLLGSAHRNVCVVGDEDQSVYSWRQADFRNLLNFEADFPGAKVVLLEQNYRSTQTILDVAQAVISPNEQRKQKNLWTENERGSQVVIHHAYNESEEAAYFAREVERRVRDQGARLGEIAVMYRVNAQSRPLEDTLVRFGIPYKLIGGTRFYERKEIKDVLAYLRLALNPFDTVSLTRVINVPARGIGARTLAEIQRWATATGASLMTALESVADEQDLEAPSGGVALQPRARNAVRGFVDLVRQLNRASQELAPIQILDFLLSRSGYEDSLRDGTDEGEERWQNILELRTKAQEFDNMTPPVGLSALLEEVALVQDVDSYDPESEGVTLITLHAAKGLEFPYVYLVGLEEGLCPHSRSIDDPAQMEEERRLVYVGITRAMRGLTLVHTYQRMLYGSPSINQPSRFLEDIPSKLVQLSGLSTAKSGLGPASGRRDARRFTFSGGRPVGTSPASAAGNGQASVWGFGGGGSPAAPGSVSATETPQPGASPAPSPQTTERQFHDGDRVYHPAFGNGVVVTSALIRGDEEVTVAFEGKGVKRLSLAYAPLQRA